MTDVTVPSSDVVSITADDIAVVVSLSAARAGDAAKVIAAVGSEEAIFRKITLLRVVPASSG